MWREQGPAKRSQQFRTELADDARGVRTVARVSTGSFFYALLSLMPLSLLILVVAGIVGYFRDQRLMERVEIGAVALFGVSLMVSLVWGLSMSGKF